MSAPAKKAPPKAKPSLIAAAGQAKPKAAAPAAPAPAPEPAPAAGPSSAMQRSATVISSGSGSGSARSTPTIQDGPAPTVAKLKFRPKVPVRKAKPVVEVKPEPGPAPAPARGGARGGRGARGGPGGRGGRGGGRGGAPQPSISIAAGIFGGPRNVPSTRGGGSFAPRAAYDDVADVYSDDEETGTSAANIVDISAVSGLGESAPTALIRAGRETGNTKEEADAKKARKDMRQAKRERSRKGKERAYGNVKAEEDIKPDIPISPVKRPMDMDMDDMDLEEMMNAGVRPPVGLRDDDHLMEGDEIQDRDATGKRLGDEEVNEALMMDLSESEEEEEEEGMEGDFVPTPGYDDPSSKLYLFQFPHLFPNFLPRGPVDMTGEGDVKPELKPTDAELRAAAGRKKKAKPQPEGRVGSLVVMRSGKVKVVMGNDIVMNITPGVPTTFLQHLVHLDTPNKSVNVLGEVNKHFVLTPDIDRLLKELWLNDGETPGEKAEKMRQRVKLEEETGLRMGGLQRMNDD